MLAETGGNHFVLVCSASDINVSQEWHAILNTTNHQIHPPWIETTATIVQATRQPIVQRFRFHANAIVVAIVFGDFLVDEFFDALEIGIVATRTQNAVVVDAENSVDITEMGQRAVRYQCVGRDDNTFVVFDANHRCTGRNRVAEVEIGKQRWLGDLHFEVTFASFAQNSLGSSQKFIVGNQMMAVGFVVEMKFNIYSSCRRIVEFWRKNATYADLCVP